MMNIYAFYVQYKFTDYIENNNGECHGTRYLITKCKLTYDMSLDYDISQPAMTS